MMRNSGNVRGVADGGRMVTAELPCKSQLLHDLGVKNMEGKTMNGCQVAQCRFKHVDIRTSSKREMHNFINNLTKKRGVKEELPAVISEAVAKDAHTAITAQK